MSSKEIPSLSDFTPEELIQLADEHDDAAFACMLESHPAMRQGDGLYEILTGIMNPYGNMLFGVQVPDTENRVSNVTKEIEKSGAPAFWWVGPVTQPKDLDSILVKNGWKEDKPAPALIIDLEKLGVAPGPPGLELLEVTTNADLAAWHEVLAEGYGLPLQVAQLIAPKLGGAMRLYTVLLEGKPVATTGVFTYRDVPGIYCVATLPDYRKRGIGAAITAIPLHRARAQGYKVGTLQSSTMGYPVYKKLGFEDVCSLRVFTFGM
jgi:GNAT superfamily N-acetyltransferase